MNGNITKETLIQVLSKTNCERPAHTFDNYADVYSVNCDEVYPNIFIGDGSTAKNKAYLTKIGITHVLNTAEGKAFSMVDTDKNFYKDCKIKYLGLPLLDHPTADISEYFYDVANFIEEGSSRNHKVYVHCFMGISRSSTCVIAYLMIKRGLSAVDATRLVREKRDIFPNYGFLEQLAKLHNTLSSQTVRPRQCATT